MIESHVRKISGRDYVCVDHAGISVAVQDFVRYPCVVPLEDEPDIRRETVQNLQRNSRRPQASAITGGKFREVWVTGKASWPVLVEDNQTAIGVGEAMTSSLVSHAVGTGTTLSVLKLARGNRDALPIGLFEVGCDHLVVDAWSSAGMVGMYRRHVRGVHAIKRLSSGTTTELYAVDPAATAVQYAVTYMMASSVKLVSCDASFETAREGAVPFGDRFAYPSGVRRILTLHAVCMIAVRNNIDVSWVRGTMIPVPGAEPLDTTVNEVESVSRISVENDR